VNACAAVAIALRGAAAPYNRAGSRATAEIGVQTSQMELPERAGAPDDAPPDGRERLHARRAR
jgi:hypothetical protein